MIIVIEELSYENQLYRVTAKGGGQDHDGASTNHELVLLPRVTFLEAFEKAKEYVATGQGCTEIRLDKILCTV